MAQQNNSDGSKPSDIFDDVTHPDGSESDIPYWVRKKIADIDSLAEEISEWMMEHGMFDEIEFTKLEPRDKLNDHLDELRSLITNLQESEKWI